MYRYEFRIIGFVIFIIFLAYKITVIIFHWEYLNNEIINWMLAFSLIIISSSKDKKENPKYLSIRYYSGRIALTYITSFIMSLNLVEIIINTKFELSNVVLVILALSMFQISYYGLKFITKNKDIEIEENNVVRTFLGRKTLYYFSIVLGLITLCLIFLLI